MRKAAILTSNWFLYSAGLILIVVPTMIMGILGARFLQNLEQQPREYNLVAKRRANYLKERMLESIYGSEMGEFLPGVPLYDGFYPEKYEPWTPESGRPRGWNLPWRDQGGAGENASDDSVGEPKISELLPSRPEPLPDGLLSLEDAAQLQHDFVTEAGGLAQVAMIFAPGQSTPVAMTRRIGSPLAGEALEHVRSRCFDTLTMLTERGEHTGFWSRAIQQAGEQHTDVVFLASAKSVEGGQGDYWTAWVLDVEVLERVFQRQAEIQQEAESRKPDSYPLKLTAMKQSDDRLYEDSQIITSLTMDPRVMPEWAIAVSLDEKQLPIGGAAWRSNFYILIGAVGSPILIVVIILLSARLRRELVDARKKVDFVANVTHELKTPLTSIRMFIEMLLMGRSRSEKDTRESLEIILRESERLGRLIDRVLEFNKLDRKRKIFNFQLESIGNVLRETVAIFRNQFGPDNARQVKLVIQSGLPPVLMDRDAYREVLLNLLTNAAKYSPEESPIGVRLYHEGRYIYTEVVDRGNGIPLDEQDRIFEKFYRVKDELNRNVEGTGLGLSIAQQIVKAHGGTISVDSRTGQGSRFIVKLPAASKLDETGRGPSVGRVG